eukprot:422830_1
MYHTFSLTTLYFTLYFVYKIEGTLKVATKDEKMLQIVVDQSQFSVETIVSEEKEENIKNIPKNMPLLTCLDEKQNCEIFSKYLAECFCLENLFYIQKVCIFRWLVMTRKSNKNINEIDLVANKSMNRRYYSLKFKYLDNIWQEYTTIIENNNTNVFENNRDLLWSISHNIYNEFICEESVNQINIPYGMRKDLERMLQSNENISKYFESYDDFLVLFTKSMDEIWSLLISVYRFKFAYTLE